MSSMDKVVAYVERNIDGSLRINTLAQVARLSGAHFSRVFTQAVGVPPGRYVRLRRLEVAMLMMRTTTQKLSEIALSTGHADQSHLSRAFREVVGISPARWRVRAGNSSEPVPQPLIPLVVSLNRKRRDKRTGEGVPANL